MFKTLIVATIIGAVSLTSAAYAKGHAQGLGGAGLAGKDLAGLVDNGQKNAGVENKSAETTYGRSDASIEAKDEVLGNKDAAAAANADRKN